ncbi:MAG: PAS domain S-box protein [Rhodospirillales bacterium]|nr:PAS domain S-box protein [Rhodospirillales bacterium]
MAGQRFHLTSALVFTVLLLYVVVLPAEAQEIAGDTPGFVWWPVPPVSLLVFGLSYYVYHFKKRLGRAESEARDREARYRAVIETAHDGFWLVDMEGRILEANEAYVRRSGYSREELLSMHVSDLDASDTPQEVAARIDMTIRDGSALFATQHRTKSGELWDVEAGGSYSDIDGGRIFAFFRDITERTRAEEQIREMNLRMALAAKSAGIGVWEHDLLTNGLTWDEGMFRLYGTEPEAFTGSNDFWRSFVHPDDLKRLDRNMETSFREHGQIDDEFRIIRPNGDLRHIKMQAVIVRDDEDRPIRMTGINYDVTKQRLAEEALRESEAAYRAAFRTSPDAVNINRVSDGIYVDINEGFTRLTGFEPVDVIGRTSEEIGIWADYEDRNTLVGLLRSHGIVENMEAQFRLKDGGITTALMSARIIDVKGEPHILSVTRDISELREAEEKLLQAQKMEVVGQLTGGIAHDFNNLLQIIEGNLELARGRLTTSDVGLSRLLNSAIEAGRRGAKLTQQLLAFSRKQSLSPEVLEIGGLVEDMLTILTRTMGENIEIKLGLDPGTAPVYADENQLQNAILNLVLNARAAMAGGGTLTISSANRRHGEAIEIGGDMLAPGSYIELTIADTGAGMPEETLARAFEPFFTTKGVGQGSGLGLSMVYGFARQSGGNVVLESEMGVGTTARMLLPAAERQAKDGENE